MHRTHHTIPMLAAALLAVSFDAPLSAQWSNVSPTTGPSGRFSCSMAYDSQRGVSVLFGGAATASTLSGTWEWDGTSWTQVATSGPAARIFTAMSYDSQRNTTVLFGGEVPPFTNMGDTWEWNGSTWTQRLASGGPLTRRGHAMAYDSQRNVTVLFGGQVTNFGLGGDTWEWNGTTWNQVATTGPDGRYFHAMAYDSQRNVTVLFGGIGDGGFLGDTWEWDGTSWTQAPTTGPPARQFHAMTYDSRRGATILFGGSDDNYGPPSFGDTWEWDGTSWTQTATTGPSARVGHAMAYDSQRAHPVLFGGQDSNSLPADTWEWLSAPAGVALYGSGCGSPSLSLAPLNTPRMGRTASCLMLTVPAPYLGAIALGFSNSSANGVPLPFDLSSIGLPGCFQLTSAEANPLPVTAGLTPGMLEFHLAIPYHASWLSGNLYLQAYCLAPGANPGGAIVSNGLEWTIGHF